VTVALAPRPALANDPAGALVDLRSPSSLDLGRAILDYGTGTTGWRTANGTRGRVFFEIP